jgi:hypothetical protein
MEPRKEDKILPHRKVGILLLVLAAVSFSTIFVHGLFGEYPDPLRVWQFFYVISSISIGLIISIIWKKGYYIQIILYCICFVASALFDGLKTPYSLIFLFMAVVLILKYRIQFDLFLIVFSCALLFIATLFGTAPDFNGALAMLVFTLVMVCILIIELGGKQ